MFGLKKERRRQGREMDVWKMNCETGKLTTSREEEGNFRAIKRQVNQSAESFFFARLRSRILRMIGLLDLPKANWKNLVYLAHALRTASRNRNLSRK